MTGTILLVLYALLAVSLGFSVFNSWKSHRSKEPAQRGLYGARMNISLGSMLILLAVIQLFMFSGSSTRVVIGALFLLLGCFNIYAGLRNHSHFNKMNNNA
ncbi:YtpI family protein [Paenibacillus guangzhouensis]|uniref:YtpI family protein n=1 Tax=Paenibacillus guangzhouensis TaxID=1473112 RepID=UPI0012673D25|nr:YtpI family protein [Paenibacillus guangzhouensis]